MSEKVCKQYECSICDGVVEYDDDGFELWECVDCYMVFHEDKGIPFQRVNLKERLTRRPTEEKSDE